MKKIIISIFVLICTVLFAQQPVENVKAEELNSSQLANKTTNYQLGDHELFIMPTAQTMPKGSAYFSDYELFFLNYTLAPTDRTHIGIFTLFPITDDFLRTITFGVKQNYFRTNNFSAAVWGSYSPDGKLATIGNVCSLTNKENSFHFALSKGVQFDNDNVDETIFMAGVKLQKFIAEYTNSNSLIEDVDFNGLLTIGFRFGGDNLKFDIAGIRPLEGDLGPFIAFPFLKVTYKLK